MLRWGRVEVTGGFLFLAAALYYLDDSGTIFWAAMACGLHELGHLLAIYGLGGRVARLRLSVSGAEMVLSAARPMGHTAHLLAALAGPVTNLGLTVLSARLGAWAGEDWYLFAGLNLSLAAFNLLPMEQLDGGRAVLHLLALLCPEHMAVRVVRMLSYLTAAALLLAGAALLWFTGTNFTLLVTAAWLAFSLHMPKRMQKGNLSLANKSRL